jgi:hypothetical protein
MTPRTNLRAGEVPQNQAGLSDGQNSKSQAPNHKQTTNDNTENTKRFFPAPGSFPLFGSYSLELVFCLAFDAWCLVFWPLGFLDTE